MLRRWTLASRDYARAALSTALPDSTVRGVALALIIGDRSLLDAGVRAHFQEPELCTYAVSGLHVGILYVILEKMLLLFHFSGKRYFERLCSTCGDRLFIWFMPC